MNWIYKVINVWKVFKDYIITDETIKQTILYRQTSVPIATGKQDDIGLKIATKPLF